MAVMHRDAPLTVALNTRGAVKRIAAAAGIRSQAVSKWPRVPERWLDLVARVTDIPAHVLRPDLRTPPRVRARCRAAAE